MWYGYSFILGLFSNYCTKVFAEKEEHYDFLNELRRKVRNENYSIPQAFDEVIKRFRLPKEHLNKYIVDLFAEIDRTGKKEIEWDLKELIQKSYAQLVNLAKTHKIITTNYDTLLEDIFERITGNQPNIFYSYSQDLNKNSL